MSVSTYRSYLIFKLYVKTITVYLSIFLTSTQMILQEAERFVANEHLQSNPKHENKYYPNRNGQPETLFSVIRRSKISDDEKTPFRMSQEGTEMFMASFTPVRTMMLGLYYLYSNLDVLKTLRKELDHINPNHEVDLKFKTLSSLPYLVSYLV